MRYLGHDDAPRGDGVPLPTHGADEVALEPFLVIG